MDNLTSRKFYCSICGMKFDNYDLNGKYHHSNHSNYRHKVKNSKALVFVGIIISFCIISITWMIITGSDNLDVESIMFYYNVLIAVIYHDEIQRDILNFDTKEIISHIDEIRTKTVKELNDKRIAERQKLEREYESLIFTYTNNERIKRGLNPFQLNEEISNIARLHSQDMLDNNFFAHDNLRGQTPADRGNALGLSCIQNVGGPYFISGLRENISYLDNYLFFHATENSKTLVNGWIESRDNEENILSDVRDQIGIGVAFSNYRIYATQNFC